MKAIILPLNKLYFNFEKYDGSNAAYRYWRKHPKLKKFLMKKAVFFVVFGPVILGMLVVLGPLYWWYRLRIGKEKANIKIDNIFAWLDKYVEFGKKKNIYPVLSKFDRNNFSQIIYFTHEMIPKKKIKKEKFFRQIELMKTKLKIAHVCEANSKEDIEKLISSFNINPQESFFMSDGKIDLS